ncbi:MAG: ester cyclase [Bacteroidia bacterium]|nr:ester cyclase [Bacteroidia bacterium]
MKNLKRGKMITGVIIAVVFMISTAVIATNASARSTKKSILVSPDSSKTKDGKPGEIIQINLEDYARINWSEKERQNAELVVDFVQHLMNDHDFEYVREKFGSNPYTQHNRGMSDGMEGVIEVVSDLAKRYPDYTYDVKHIYVDGDYVIIHTHSTLKMKHRGNPNKGLNIIDSWKVVDGKIVEHWDSIQAIHGSMRFYALMTGGKVKNSNTLF